MDIKSLIEAKRKEIQILESMEGKIQEKEAVINALNLKLAEKTAENEELKKKIAKLEGIIENVTKDYDVYKEEPKEPIIEEHDSDVISFCGSPSLPSPSSDRSHCFTSPKLRQLDDSFP